MSNARNVSKFWHEFLDEFDTGFFSPEFNFSLYVLSLVIGIMGFIAGAMV